MKKRTKEENRLYSKQLRDKRKALRASSSVEMQPESIAPAPEQPINYPGQYIRVALTPAPATAPVCADCALLRAEICNLKELISTLDAIASAKLSGLNAVIKDQAAEIIELRQTISALKAEADNIRPPATPVKVKVGADDKTLFDRVMEAKINRFGRNTSIGSVR